MVTLLLKLYSTRTFVFCFLVEDEKTMNMRAMIAVMIASHDRRTDVAKRIQTATPGATAART